jgi:uncharacterized protein YaaR (DUF327 family)
MPNRPKNLLKNKSKKSKKSKKESSENQKDNFEPLAENTTKQKMAKKA